jgi:hypothetical protein
VAVISLVPVMVGVVVGVKVLVVKTVRVSVGVSVGVNVNQVPVGVGVAVPVGVAVAPDEIVRTWMADTMAASSWPTKCRFKVPSVTLTLKTLS